MRPLLYLCRISAFFTLIFWLPVQAVEVHSFLLTGCQIRTGLVIDLKRSELTLLQLNGQSVGLKSAAIKGVFVTSTLENPVEIIKPDPLNSEALRSVQVGDQTFLGWPVRFIESLAIFYDINGRTRVHEKETITRIRPAPSKWSPTAQGKPLTSLDLSDLSSECPNIGEGSGLRPNRIMVDQIKVDQYLSDLMRGYDDLRAYEERTYLYARPQLFDPKTRLIITSVQDRFERSDSIFPVGIQWSSGQPYGFQSFTQLGALTAETSPYFLPFGGIRSELKAHLFHASFTGDFRGLSGGSPVFSEILNTDSFKRPSEADLGMNYLLMMGADYENFSVSAGFFYPTHFLRVGSAYREILANRQAFAVRGMYTTRTAQFYVLGSNFDFNSNAPTEDDFRTNGNRLLSFSLNGQLVRAGLQWNWDSLTKIGLDAGVNRAVYAGSSLAGNEFLNFSRWVVSTSARRDFGDYIGLSLFAAWSLKDRTYSVFATETGAPSGLAGEDRQTEFTLGGQFEILL